MGCLKYRYNTEVAAITDLPNKELEFGVNLYVHKCSRHAKVVFHLTKQSKETYQTRINRRRYIKRHMPIEIWENEGGAIK